MSCVPVLHESTPSCDQNPAIRSGTISSTPAINTASRTPCVGFGLGLERLLMLLDAMGVTVENADRPDIFVVSQNPALVPRCRDLVTALRQEGVAADTEYTGRSLKAQLRYADKLNARYAVVIGDSEAESGLAMIKDLAAGPSEQVNLNSIGKYITEKKKNG